MAIFGGSDMSRFAGLEVRLIEYRALNKLF
jgi:hypothetical protein